MRCNICGSTEFVDMNSRKGVRCKKCGSLERTRLLYLYIQKLNFTSVPRILHIAPERGLSEKLYELAGENYISADISMEYEWCRNFRQIDLTELDEIPSNSYDLIVHSHVLEHIPCNIAYTLFHLHRILKPAGVHLCVIPFTGEYWDECFAEIGEKERKRRFGQEDHVRRFGRKDLSKSLGKIIRLPEEVDLLQEFTEAELKEANIPEGYWRGFSMTTVLKLRKEDYLLTDPNSGNPEGAVCLSGLTDSEEAFWFAKEAQYLRECLALTAKENRGLKQQVKTLQNSSQKMKKYEAEAKKHKESIRYRIGTAFVEAVTSVKGFFLFPARITGLFLEKLNGRK